MSLQFIVGSSGTGKSTYIYNRIIDKSMKNPGRTYIIVVPEQNTLQTQKELVRLHPDNVIMNIDVLSFNRLAYRVFDELGIETLDILEETGKNLLIRKLSMDHKDELRVLGRGINKAGYISEIKSFISELAQYNISASDFENIASEGELGESFKRKANDIAIIYKAYEDYIRDRYITAEGLLVRLNEVIVDSSFLNDSEFVFDGFTGFTPLQNELLKTMLPRINKSYVVVTMDSREPLYGDIKEYELFAMSKNMIARTRRICEMCNVEIEDAILLDKNYRLSEGGSIDFIERHLFRPGDKATFPMEETGDLFKIHCLNNPRLEIEYVAASIAKDIREDNRRYKDIAICSANLDAYKNHFEEIFNRYNIPFYIDSSTSVVFHPIIEFIRSAFMIVEYNFSRDSVMHFMRCNLTDITMDEVDVLDNYLYASKIRGVKAYSNEFAYEPRAFAGRLPMVNDIRKRFAKPLVDFYNSVNGCSDVRTISTGLYQLLLDYNVEVKLNERRLQLEEAGEEIKAKEYSQIYRVIISILDKMVTLLEGEDISTKDYVEIMLSACEGAKIATIPMSNDCVLIGDLERSRYDKPKVMYLMGVNDGAIPATYNSSGIISQSERIHLKEYLSGKDVMLAPTDREKSFMQRFYVYMILTKASEKLCITYSCNDIDAKPLNRSYLISELQELFANNDLVGDNELLPSDWMVSPESASMYASSSLRRLVHEDECDTIDVSKTSLKETNDLEATISLLKYCNDNNITSLENVLKGAFFYHNKEEIDKKLYEKLVNSDNPVGSVSKLESYRRCAYRYFLQYCLNINERENNKLDARDYGNVYHDILEEFSLELDNEGISWKDVSNEQSREILSKASDKVYEGYERIKLLDTPKDLFTKERIMTTMIKTIDILRDQAKNTHFEPKRFEVKLDKIASPKDLKITLDNGKDMVLDGRIDRLDLCEEEDKVLVKIIDYKSGNNKVDYGDIYNGLQLQLIYYLHASVEGLSSKYDKEVKPSAMFYYGIKDPIIEMKDLKDSIDNEIKKEMRPKGLFFDEVKPEYVGIDDEGLVKPENLMQDVAKQLDINYTDEIDDKYQSMYAHFDTKKNGDFGAHSNCISIDDYRTIEEHVLDTMRQIGSDMYDGKIDASPLHKKNEGCKYCPYSKVCEFDIRQPGFENAKYVEASEKNIISLIKDGKKVTEE